MINNLYNEIKPQFLINPDIIFLNHGSFGATPQPVFDSYQRWQRELEFQPVEFLGRRASNLLLSAREKLAKFLCTSQNNLVYVTNATIGLNIIARSLHLTHRDEVLSSNHEYGALDRTWKFISQKNGFTYINQSIKTPITSTKEMLADLWKGVTPNTRVLFISHITSPTAVIFPIRQICEKARAAGIITIIDGAHAPGQIPLALDSLGADFYVGNLHKWLCAPKGSAFLYARPEVQSLIEPLIVSWGWQSDSPTNFQFVDYLEWSGTRDISAFLAVPDAIEFHQKYQWEKIQSHCHSLAQFTRQKLEQITGLPSLYPDSPEFYAQMGTAVLPLAIDINDFKSKLYTNFKIEIPVILWNDKKLIRFSYQAYNSFADANCLINAVNHLLNNDH